MLRSVGHDAAEQGVEADTRPKVARTEARSPTQLARSFVLASSSRGRVQLNAVFDGRWTQQTMSRGAMQVRAHSRSTVGEPWWVVAAVILSVPGIVSGLGSAIVGATMIMLPRSLPSALEIPLMLAAVATFAGAFVSPVSCLAALLVLGVGSLAARSPRAPHTRAWVILLLAFVGAALAFLVAPGLM